METLRNHFFTLTLLCDPKEYNDPSLHFDVLSQRRGLVLVVILAKDVLLNTQPFAGFRYHAIERYFTAFANPPRLEREMVKIHTRKKLLELRPVYVLKQRVRPRFV